MAQCYSTIERALIHYPIVYFDTSHQTQDICISFVQCWTNVEDAGPTLYKCLQMFCVRCDPSKHETFAQCCFNVGPATKTMDQHWNNIRWMPRVCWDNKRVLFLQIHFKCASFELTQATQNNCMTCVQCWTNVEDVGPELNKCYTFFWATSESFFTKNVKLILFFYNWIIIDKI